MIDTICLLIPTSKVQFLDKSAQGVPAWDMQAKTAQYTRYVKNPSQKEQKSGLYMPRLSVYTRPFVKEEKKLRIEFSLPKLILGNNLEELGDDDFENTLQILKERLEMMGVRVDGEVLRMASVSSVHFSKNILLPEGVSVRYVLSQLQKANVQKYLDVAKTRFLNEGESFFMHATSHEFTVYDKLSDLRKGEKRAIDKDKTQKEHALADVFEKAFPRVQVLRFEVRLNSKQKMNSVLVAGGYVKNPVFQDVFSEKASQYVVRHYWEAYLKGRSAHLFLLPRDSPDILRSIQERYTGMKPKQIIYLFGLYALQKDEMQLRVLRSLIEQKSSSRTWYRVYEDMGRYQDILGGDVRTWAKSIDESLEKYVPFRTSQAIPK